MSDFLLEVQDLSKWFPVKKRVPFEAQSYVRAVTGVSFGVLDGETLGVVGESGCGKSTLGRTMIRLLQPTAGRITFQGRDVTSLPERAMRKARRGMQMMFQDPYASLDPRMTVENVIAEPMDIQNLYPDKRERLRRVMALMETCGLRPEYLARYPHEFSGGQRQRIGIARALSVEPKLIVCDEPVSALDVSIQAQIINLMIRLQRERGLSLVFISHDLSVVHHIADRVMVMYLGKVMELGTKRELFEKPLHPYTQALLSSIPIVGEETLDQVQALEGEIPSPVNPPSGCPFRTRCPKVCQKCEFVVPQLQDMGGGHMVACILA